MDELGRLRTDAIEASSGSPIHLGHRDEGGGGEETGKSWDNQAEG